MGVYFFRQTPFFVFVYATAMVQICIVGKRQYYLTMFLALTIAAIIVAFLPFAILLTRGRKATMQQGTPADPQPDIETVAYRLLTNSKQQQPVPEQFVRPVLAYSNAIHIVDERLEFGGNEWIHAQKGEIKNTGLCAEILKKPVCAN